MTPIPHDLFTDRNLPLFPDVVGERRELALDRREALITRLLRRSDEATVLAHVSAILSPYQVEAMAQVAITRCWREADTEEEAIDLFDEWLDDLAREYLLD